MVGKHLPIRGAMKIGLSPDQWTELNVSEQRLFVRAAFFLGMPYNYIQNRCRYEAHEYERHELIESALELGMREDDNVFILQRKKA